jgi:hypothetical protein
MPSEPGWGRRVVMTLRRRGRSASPSLHHPLVSGATATPTYRQGPPSPRNSVLDMSGESGDAAVPGGRQHVRSGSYVRWHYDLTASRYVKRLRDAMQQPSEFDAGGAIDH